MMVIHGTGTRLSPTGLIVYPQMAICYYVQQVLVIRTYILVQYIRGRRVDPISNRSR